MSDRGEAPRVPFKDRLRGLIERGTGKEYLSESTLGEGGRIELKRGEWMVIGADPRAAESWQRLSPARRRTARVIKVDGLPSGQLSRAALELEITPDGELIATALNPEHNLVRASVVRSAFNPATGRNAMLDVGSAFSRITSTEMARTGASTNPQFEIQTGGGWKVALEPIAATGPDSSIESRGYAVRIAPPPGSPQR